MPRARPLLEPQVRTEGLSPARVIAPGPSGLNEVAGAVNQVGEAAAALYETATARANAAQVTAVETEGTDAINRTLYDRDTGLMNLRGDKALAAEPAAWEAIERKRAELSQRLNPEQREMFSKRFDGLLRDTKRQVDAHMAQQVRVKEADAVEGRQRTALDAIANSSTDVEGINHQIAAVEGPLAALSPSPEGREAAVAEWRKKAWMQAIQSRAAAGDADTALKYLNDNRQLLGAQADDVERSLKGLHGSVVAERQAVAIIGSAVDKNGWVDADKALAELDKVPEGPLRDETRQRLEHRIQLADQQKKSDIEDRYQKALTSYQLTGSVPGDLRVWLIQNAPEKWLAFQRAEAAEKRSRHVTDTQARAEQRRINSEALSGFKALESDLQVQMDPDVLYPDADVTTRNLIRQEQKKARGEIGKATAIAGDDFKRAITAEAARAGIKDKNRVAQFTGAMNDWRLRWLDEHGGKSPTRKDALEQIADLLIYNDGGWLGKGRFKFEANSEEVEDFAAQGDQPYPENQHTPAPPAAPPPPSAALAPPAPSKPNQEDRAAQLVRQGKSDAEIDEIIFKEYGVHAH